MLNFIKRKIRHLKQTKPKLFYEGATPGYALPKMSVSDSVQALEPRIMFDAAGAATGAEVAADDVAEQQAEQALTPENLQAQAVNQENEQTDEVVEALAELVPPSGRNEIIFIDKSIGDYTSLISEISGDAELIFIEPNSDGLEQIANALQGRTGIDAIHIVSHGDSGELFLGNTTLTQESIQGEHADELAMIKAALSEDADLLIYGCNFAEGEVGRSAAEALADATGADVAASEDLTGHESLGGDWDLEFISGEVGTVTINAEAYEGILAPIPLSFTGVQFVDGSTVNDIYGQTSDGTDDRSVGDQYLFQNVDGANAVDAVVTITGYTWTDNLGNDLSGGGVNLPTISNIDNTGAGIAEAWQPVLDMPALAGANQEWTATLTVQYFAAGTANSLTVDSFVTPIDIDGNSGTNEIREAVSVTAPVVSVQQNNPTTINTNLSYANGQTTIELEQSDSQNFNPGITPPGTPTTEPIPAEQYAATFEVQQANIFTVELKSITGSAGGEDDRLFSISFDEATFSSPQTLSVSLLDLDADDSSGATDLDYTNTNPYNVSDNASGIPIVDTSDITISDSNSSVTDMASATITLTNPIGGDQLNVDAAFLLSNYGITATGDGTDTITFTGNSSFANYEAALASITYSTTDTVLDGTDRVIEFTINNGLTNNPDSPVATATINVLGTPTVDPIATSNSSQPTVTGTWDETAVTNTNLQVTIDGVDYVLGTDPELSSDGSGNWTLDLTGSSQNLTEGNFEVVASNVTNDPVPVVIDSDNTTGALTIDFVPVADNYTTSIGQPLTVSGLGVLQNDSDNSTVTVSAVNGVPGNVSVATATTNGGTITLNANGDFVYTPPSGFTGNDTFTYSIVDTSGANTVTVTINVSGEVQAVNDTGTTDEDNTLSVGALPDANNVLNNDADLRPDLVTSNLTINNDAELDDDDGSQWDDEVSGADNWSLGANVSSQSTSSNFPGINNSFLFTPNNSTADGATMVSFESVGAGNPTQNSASFELWFKPNDFLTADEEVLFETGATTDGLAITLAGDTINFITRDNAGTIVETSADLGTLGIDASEFIQVVGVIDYSDVGNELKLYVNGSFVSQTTVGSFVDWAGGNGSGLGTDRNNSAINGVRTTTDFDGEIAKFRFYESALSLTEVQQNFDHVAGAGTDNSNLTVTAVSDPVTGGSGTLSSAFTLDSGAQVTLNADGSYDYNS